MAEAEPTLLLVDGNRADLEVLSRRLRRKGFLVVEALSGEDALRTIAIQPVDLAVLDLRTPEMGGAELLRRLRNQPISAKLPVIMLAERADASQLQPSLERGADVYLTKPIDIEGLVLRIRALLRHRPALPEALAAHPAMSAAMSAMSLPPLVDGRIMLSGGPMLSVPADSSDQLAPAHYVGPGTVLDGRYRLEIMIDRGGFGSVFKAVDLQNLTVVAIKILHSHLMASPQIVRRFAREGISGCRVAHPNAVVILDNGATANGTPYLVMEYLEGITLEAELKANGVMPFSRCATIIGQVCDVLIQAHAAGILHRDIKPANIHLTRTADGERVKVLDFGLAKLLEEDSAGYVSSGETLIGTPQFMSPERLLGKPADGRADVYSVGVTLYLMLSGTLPYGDSEEGLLSRALLQIHTPAVFIQRIRPDIPDELAVLIMRMVARSRRERPSLAEIKQQTAEWAERWVEAWPPMLHHSRNAPLEIGETRKLTEDGATASAINPLATLPTPPQGARVPLPPSGKKRR